jgi:integrase
MVHGVREVQKRGKGHSDRPLWPSARNTAWRHVKAMMDVAGIPDGPHRSPKGLRHGYGVHAISSGVPPNMLSKWMGHATLEVTAIYANALGAEDRGTPRPSETRACIEYAESIRRQYSGYRNLPDTNKERFCGAGHGGASRAAAGTACV